MDIKQFVWEAVDSNSWLLTEGEHGLLIDAVDSNELYTSISELESLTIILTHSHFDHIVGLNQIRELKPDTTVIATELCSNNIGNKHRNMSSTADAFMTFYHEGENKDYKILPIICEPADRTFDNAYTFDWCGHEVNIMAVHGHSDDGLIVEMDNRILFSGDTLLSIPTVTRFPRGNSKRFWLEDMQMLMDMEHIEYVYPGHGQKGNIGEMLKANKIPERYSGVNGVAKIFDNLVDKK